MVAIAQVEFILFYILLSMSVYHSLSLIMVATAIDFSLIRSCDRDFRQIMSSCHTFLTFVFFIHFTVISFYFHLLFCFSESVLFYCVLYFTVDFPFSNRWLFVMFRYIAFFSLRTLHFVLCI